MVVLKKASDFRWGRDHGPEGPSLAGGDSKNSLPRFGLPRSKPSDAHSEAVEFKLTYRYEQSLRIVCGAGQEFHNHFQLVSSHPQFRC